MNESFGTVIILDYFIIHDGRVDVQRLCSVVQQTSECICLMEVLMVNIKAMVVPLHLVSGSLSCRQFSTTQFRVGEDRPVSMTVVHARQRVSHS